MIYISNSEGLIGDFLGTVPAMQELAKSNRLVVEIHPEAEKLVSIIDNPNDIIFSINPSGGSVDKLLNSSKAFSIATANDWYMTQAFMYQVGLPVPLVPPKAILKYSTAPITSYDYIVSPFARSLPSDQKLSRKVWQGLIDSMPNKTFCIIGDTKYNDLGFLQGHNVAIEFDKPFDYVCNLLVSANEGLISVVTGTSHLAFHLGVKNWILNNQDFKWGTNPDGISIRESIPTITVDSLKKYLVGNK